MGCNTQYLPLCSIPARMSRDGYAGQYAKIYVPFVGFYMFNGGVLNLPTSTVSQDHSKFMAGVTKSGYSHSGC